LTRNQAERPVEPCESGESDETSHNNAHNADVAGSDSTTHSDSARGYSWPPFEPGNTAAVTHGAHSAGIVDSLAAEYAQAAVDAAPYLALDRFAFALSAWARAEARCELLSRHLDRHGVLNNRGTPRQSILRVLGTSERAAAHGRDALGLSPESAARIAAMIRAGGADLLSPDERKELAP
jgi:hypothetical protein